MLTADRADEAWRWYIALEGEDLDGRFGRAGILRMDWPSKAVTYRYYDGVAAGHNVSIAPGGKLLLLGNFSQQIVVVDAANLEVLGRQATMAIEECDYRLRSPTHFVWSDDRHFIGAVGDNLYRFDLADLAHPEKLGPHLMLNVHEMRASKDGRYLLLSDLGGESVNARHVGIFDTVKRTSAVIRLPDTVWHVAVDAERSIGYAATYSTAVEDGAYVQFSAAYTTEYIFEIDLPAAKVRRTWSSAASFPVHLNSDIEYYANGGQPRLYIASGGSHSLIEVNLEDFASTRRVMVLPSFWKRFWNWRQLLRNVIGAFIRKGVSNTHMLLQTYLAAGWRSFDGVYAARVSPDGRYIAAGNRGFNYLRIMDRSTLKTVYDVKLPRLERGLHLGLHHSEISAGACS
jgi:hypothetical protein